MATARIKFLRKAVGPSGFHDAGDVAEIDARFVENLLRHGVARAASDLPLGPGPVDPPKAGEAGSDPAPPSSAVARTGPAPALAAPEAVTPIPDAAAGPSVSSAASQSSIVNRQSEIPSGPRSPVPGPAGLP